MQVDFINGALGSRDAEAILPTVLKKVKEFDGKIIFTRDTHKNTYSDTQEGRKLPIPHCIKGSDGWRICDTLRPCAVTVVDKPTFGSMALPEIIGGYGQSVDEIELCGLCTDICVISNAMILKAAFPEARITVDGAACAGVTPESHATALAAMRSVQIEVR